MQKEELRRRWKEDRMLVGEGGAGALNWQRWPDKSDRTVEVYVLGASKKEVKC